MFPHLSQDYSNLKVTCKKEVFANSQFEALAQECLYIPLTVALNPPCPDDVQSILILLVRLWEDSIRRNFCIRLLTYGAGEC